MSEFLHHINIPRFSFFFFFFFNDTATTEIYTLSLHDALPISFAVARLIANSYLVGSSTASSAGLAPFRILSTRSEEHTSELQSHSDLVCRLLLEKKKKKKNRQNKITRNNTQYTNHNDHLQK